MKTHIVSMISFVHPNKVVPFKIDPWVSIKAGLVQKTTLWKDQRTNKADRIGGIHLLETREDLWVAHSPLYFFLGFGQVHGWGVRAESKALGFTEVSLCGETEIGVWSIQDSLNFFMEEWKHNCREVNGSVWEVCSQRLWPLPSVGVQEVTPREQVSG